MKAFKEPERTDRVGTPGPEPATEHEAGLTASSPESDSGVYANSTMALQAPKGGRVRSPRLMRLV